MIRNLSVLLLAALGLSATEPTLAAQARVERETHLLGSAVRVDKEGRHPRSLVFEMVVPEITSSSSVDEFVFFSNSFRTENAKKGNRGKVALTVEIYRDGLFVGESTVRGRIRDSRFVLEGLPEEARAGDRLVVTFRFSGMPRVRPWDHYGFGVSIEAGGEDEPSFWGGNGFHNKSHGIDSTYVVEKAGKHPRKLVLETIVPELPEITPAGYITKVFQYTNEFETQSGKKGNKGRVEVTAENFRDGVFVGQATEEGRIRNNAFEFRGFPDDLQAGDRLVFTLKFAGMPTLRKLDRYRLELRSEVLVEPPPRTFKTKVDDAVPRTPYVFPHNGTPIRLYGPCNAEDHHILAWARFYRYDEAGKRVWMTPNENPRPGDPQFWYLIRAGECSYDHVGSGSFLSFSVVEGTSTGVQIVLVRDDDRSKVIKRFNFEGDPKYSVEWVLP